MILAIDAGNTNLVVGCLDQKKKYFEGRLSTRKDATAMEYAIQLQSLLHLYGVEKEALEGGIISTVVSQLTGTLRSAVSILTGKAPLVVGPGVKTGLNIKIDNPAQLGADMVVAAVAAIAKYPLPQIVVDMGTATTASVIDETGAFRGGAIIPGVKAALDALSGSTSQLPFIELAAPNRVIGTNTVDCMQSGSVFGAAAMLDGMVERMEAELGRPCTVIATGGIAQCVVPHCKRSMILDQDLLLDGLCRLYYKNQA